MTIERIEHELCTGCGVCVLTCAQDVIRMDKKIKKAVIRYPEECQMCQWCAKDCPEGAITIALNKGLPIIASWQ